MYHLQTISDLLEDMHTLYEDTDYLGGTFSISDTFSLNTEEMYE